MVEHTIPWIEVGKQVATGAFIGFENFRESFRSMGLFAVMDTNANPIIIEGIEARSIMGSIPDEAKLLRAVVTLDSDGNLVDKHYEYQTATEGLWFPVDTSLKSSRYRYSKDRKLRFSRTIDREHGVRTFEVQIWDEAESTYYILDQRVSSLTKSDGTIIDTSIILEEEAVAWQ